MCRPLSNGAAQAKKELEIHLLSNKCQFLTKLRLAVVEAGRSNRRLSSRPDITETIRVSRISAAKLAVILAGESPANRGGPVVSSM
jgi:hypothetical protein